MRWKHRYTILAIICGAWVLCYMDRMVMANAIPFIARDFHLSKVAMGAVLSAFFVGYSVVQLPGGLLADRFGPRVVLAAGIAWWSLMTAATGIAPGFTALIATRFLFGLGEGPFPAAASKAFSIWFPRHELARATGLGLAATSIGSTIAPLFVGAVIVTWGWRWLYFFLFAPGMLVAGLALYFVRNARAQSRYVTPKELAEFDPLPPEKITIWASLSIAVKTPAILWCAARLFISNIVSWGLLNWLPTYLLEARHFGVYKMTILSALINLFGALGIVVGGYICDKFFSKRLYMPLIISSVAGAVFTYLAAIAPTGDEAAICLAALFITSSLGSPAMFTLPIIVVPKHAVGGAFGIVNTAGQLAGILAPLLVGYLLQLTGSNFVFVLNVMVAITLVSIIPALYIRQAAGSSTLAPI